MAWAVSLLAGFLILSSILVVVFPLLDFIFDISVFGYFQDCFDIITEYVGTDGTKLIVVCFILVLILYFARFLLSFISISGGKANK